MINLNRDINTITKEELIAALYDADDKVRIAQNEVGYMKRNEEFSINRRKHEYFRRGYFIGCCVTSAIALITLLLVHFFG